MRKPIFVRELTEAERKQLEAGLRSPDAFVLRRSQVILASARRERAPVIARNIGCNDQTVRNIIRAFERSGLDFLKPGSRRPHTIHTVLDTTKVEKLRDMVQQSPRSFGKPQSLWTLDTVAEVAFEQGLTERQVSGEAIRLALDRLGMRWKRAKQWIGISDPEYRRKKHPGRLDSSGRE
jgi:transposase